jgi:aminoglycoside/choline kinase family phosphotransferase
VIELVPTLEGLGLRPVSVTALAGDASHRRFFRVVLGDGASVVACLYPDGGDAQAVRDAEVQRWGNGHGLPIPRHLACSGRVTVSQDLGDLDLERALGEGRPGVLDAVLDTLACFQLCSAEGLSTPPFDGPFWRRELAVFERFAMPAGHRDGATVSAFLDELARRLAAHPSRLVHRDFHVNNLFWHAEGVWAVDFQDMRRGPDTYDASSLLRERAGVGLVRDPARWLETAALRLGWSDGWRDRYLECAAQRGLKVVGTFLRLENEGRDRYATWLADVARQAAAALRSLASPPAVVEALRRATSDAGV